MASDHFTGAVSGTVTFNPPHQHNHDDLDEEEEESDYETGDDGDSNSNSSPDPSTVAVPPPPPPPQTQQPLIISFIASADLKRQRIESSSLLQQPQIGNAVRAAAVTASPFAVAVRVNEQLHQPARKQLHQQPVDEVRKLFQRLWTDEDEIELLQGFYEYTSQRGINNNNAHNHNDITLFYDQIKSKLQLEFNRNQLVEKLRRLKKKYRTNVARIGSGKEFVFKIPHDFATFSISRKIWGDSGGGIIARDGTVNVVVAAEGLVIDTRIDDEDPKRKHGISISSSNTPNHHHSNNIGMMTTFDLNNTDKSASVSVNHARYRASPCPMPFLQAKGEEQTKTIVSPVSSSIHGLIEETVKSYLSPLLKEVLSNAKNGGARGMLLTSPTALSFGGSSAIGNSLLVGETVAEKWRKQHIMELEVYSRRLDLVQDQIKATLEELRSAGSS